MPSRSRRTWSQTIPTWPQSLARTLLWTCSKRASLFFFVFCLVFGFFGDTRLRKGDSLGLASALLSFSSCRYALASEITFAQPVAIASSILLCRRPHSSLMAVALVWGFCARAAPSALVHCVSAPRCPVTLTVQQAPTHPYLTPAYDLLTADREVSVAKQQTSCTGSACLR